MKFREGDRVRGRGTKKLGTVRADGRVAYDYGAISPLTAEAMTHGQAAGFDIVEPYVSPAPRSFEDRLDAAVQEIEDRLDAALQEIRTLYLILLRISEEER